MILGKKYNYHTSILLAWEEWHSHTSILCHATFPKSTRKKSYLSNVDTSWSPLMLSLSLHSWRHVIKPYMPISFHVLGSVSTTCSNSLSNYYSEEGNFLLIAHGMESFFLFLRIVTQPFNLVQCVLFQYFFFFNSEHLHLSPGQQSPVQSQCHFLWGHICSPQGWLASIWLSSYVPPKESLNQSPAVTVSFARRQSSSYCHFVSQISLLYPLGTKFSTSLYCHRPAPSVHLFRGPR